jgi:threonine dehydrogenase-like Zn-dependent dehydrogenase
VNPAGRLVLVGYFQGRISFDQPQLMRKEMTVIASRNSCFQFRRVIGMMERGELNTDPWITCRLGLPEVPARLPELARHKNYIKVVVEVRESDL